MQIWKFELELTDQQILEIPQGAKILTLQMQKHDEGEVPRPYFWAEVDPGAPMEERMFLTFGTGKEIPDAFRNLIRHVGTYQQEPFVWHVYEAIKQKPEQQQAK